LDKIFQISKIWKIYQPFTPIIHLSMNKIAVVILNYNGVDFLRKFLPLVIQYSIDAEVIIADNASTDESIPFLNENYPQTRIIQLSQNEGFSKGYNLALQQVEAEYYVLLNSDVEVTPNWLVPVIAFMDKNPQVAACQPKIKAYHDKSKFEYAGAGGGFLDKYAVPFCRGRLFDTLEDDKGQYDDIKEIFWATGACMFVRAKIYHALGGLDDDFFAHMEEIDLCWRIKNAGHQIFYVGASTIYHVGGGTLAKSNPFKTFLNFRNRLAMLYKNLPAQQMIPIFLVVGIFDVMTIASFVLDRDWKNAKAIMRAYISFWQKRRIWAKKRTKTLSNTAHKEMLPKSLIFQYFFLGNRNFNDLRF
jgi:GT2 family glycosyltransferase